MCTRSRIRIDMKHTAPTVPAAVLPKVERVVSGRSSLPILDRVVSGRSKKFGWFPIPVALTCGFSAKLAENPQFMATVPRTEKNPMFSTYIHKDWPIKKLTKVYSRFLVEKLSKFFLFFYLHFF